MWKDRGKPIHTGRSQEPSALEIAAEQMRKWNSIDPGWYVISVYINISKYKNVVFYTDIFNFLTLLICRSVIVFYKSF